MNVLYDPLESESGTRATIQRITEYESSISQALPNGMDAHNSSIIAVHGLGSKPDRAWVHRESNHNWLNDFLPDDLAHKARIMVYNHQSSWEAYAFTKRFDGFAQDLLRALEDVRGSDEACTRVFDMLNEVFCF